MSLTNQLHNRIDNSPLIVFRILFGLLLFVECIGAMLTGWIKTTFIAPKIHFTFIGFEFLEVFIGPQIYIYYGVMGALGLLIMAGLCYKIATASFTFLWWGAYLMQKVQYNNHYYLLILLSAIMFLLPAHRYKSLDVKLGRVKEELTCPAWCVKLLVLQLGIVYFFAAVNKLHPDWLQGRPVEIWFSQKVDSPLIGPLFRSSVWKMVVVYGGILYDLLIVPLLLWKRTRVLAFVLSLFFHLTNAITFQIGIFPFVMLAMTPLFFPPELSRKIFFRKKPTADAASVEDPAVLSEKKRLITCAIGLYAAVQLYLPLRHLHYEGNVNWTEEGHRMSWRMMLRSKRGTFYYMIKDPATNKTEFVDPFQYLTRQQYTIVATRPDMIWQMSQWLKKDLESKGKKNCEIYAFTQTSLNGHPFVKLIDDKTDLAKTEWEHFGESEWIVKQ